MYLSPTTVPAWFPYLFVCYAAGIRWDCACVPLASGLALLLVMITAVKGEIHFMRVVAWMGLVGATLAAGGGSAFLEISAAASPNKMNCWRASAPPCRWTKVSRNRCVCSWTN